jgi:hypothetical protein
MAGDVQAPQVTFWPQLFCLTVPPQAPAQAEVSLSGSQQAPLTQTAVPDAQLGLPPGPQ